MLILASQSPRRAELLRNAGIPFRVWPANVPEVRNQGESPLDYVQRLARAKAEAIAVELADADIALGADTVVVLGDSVLEKPSSDLDAKEMLRQLAGRAHQVMTGVCLAGPRSGFVEVATEITEVRFTPIDDAEIENYVASGEPLDKAGAYGIQGIASRWIAGLTGCYFNVVGLPVPLVYRMLRRAGHSM
jgi:septum formation protein